MDRKSRRPSVIAASATSSSTRPEAIIGILTAALIRAAAGRLTAGTMGVCPRVADSGRSGLLTAVTVMALTPAASAIWAVRAASSIVIAGSAPSSRESSLHQSGKPDPTSARIAPITSSSNRARFSWVPP